MNRPGHWQATSRDTDTIKREIDEWLYAEVGGVVQAGPFEGMKIEREVAWRDTRLAPLLLGCYEEELQGELERQIQRLKRLAQPKIAVLGCAEGYYAVGLKRRLPHADVFVVDANDAAIEICGRAAAANGVSVIAGAPLNTVMELTDFMVMDVEGAEVAYLDCARWRSLGEVTAIVEIHNLPATETSPEQKTDDILLERFRGSHRINFVLEGPRNPNKYKWLCGMTSDYRWLALSEGRTCWMGWFTMEPRGMVLS